MVNINLGHSLVLLALLFCVKLSYIPWWPEIKLHTVAVTVSKVAVFKVLSLNFTVTVFHGSGGWI